MQSSPIHNFTAQRKKIGFGISFQVVSSRATCFSCVLHVPPILTLFNHPNSTRWRIQIAKVSFFSQNFSKYRLCSWKLLPLPPSLPPSWRCSGFFYNTPAKSVQTARFAHSTQRLSLPHGAPAYVQSVKLFLCPGCQTVYSPLGNSWCFLQSLSPVKGLVDCWVLSHESET
jgi:hypothetical protein